MEWLYFWLGFSAGLNITFWLKGLGEFIKWMGDFEK